MRASKRRIPGIEAAEKSTTPKSQWFPEAVAIAVVGMLLTVIMMDTVAGMGTCFFPSSEIGYTQAGVGNDGH